MWNTCSHESFRVATWQVHFGQTHFLVHFSLNILLIYVDKFRLPHCHATVNGGYPMVVRNGTCPKLPYVSSCIYFAVYTIYIYIHITCMTQYQYIFIYVEIQRLMNFPAMFRWNHCANWYLYALALICLMQVYAYDFLCHQNTRR